MKFKINDGLNKISIGLSDIGSYFNFENPISVEWDDCRGTEGKYFCLLSNNENYRKELRDRITDNLNNDFSDDIEKLYAVMKPLFQLFRDGEYSLNYFSSKEKAFFSTKHQAIIIQSFIIKHGIFYSPRLQM